MFKVLQPLLTERSIHILLSPGKDGRIGVYVEPVALDDKESPAFVTPFRCEGTPDELDAELPGVLAQWVGTRSAITTTLREALAAAEAQAKAAAEEARKKAAGRTRKPALPGQGGTLVKSGVKPAPSQAVMPSLLDAPTTDHEDDEDSQGDVTPPGGAATAESTNAPAQRSAVSDAGATLASAAPPAPLPPTPAAEAVPAPSAIVTRHVPSDELF